MLRCLFAGSTGLLFACANSPIPFESKKGILVDAPSSPEKLKTTLDLVLRCANDKFQYESDTEIYGESDFWTPASEINNWRGDCEDHALLCREMLADTGINGSLLLTCWTETEQYHCVLYLHGWVLDVRHSRVMSNTDLEKIGYKWHKAGLEDGRWFYITLLV